MRATKLRKPIASIPSILISIAVIEPAKAMFLKEANNSERFTLVCPVFCNLLIASDVWNKKATMKAPTPPN
jgi:hypothetical protein